MQVRVNVPNLVRILNELNVEARLKIQSKIQNEVGKIHAKSNAKVSKMYWKSKKKVYGIDNELHLVE